MSAEAERYLPQMTGAHISYEHWHRYLFAARHAAGKAVLDIASGDGYGSRLLAESAESVVGVDIDPAAVRDATANYPAWNLSFLCGSAEQIPVTGEHVFDIIVSFETLEHLTAEGQLRFASEIQRLLKPDGLLLISTPNRPVYTDQSGHHNPYHLCEFDRQEFADYLRRHFAHVEMLCQRVYPGSYIWNADRPVTTYTEHQLALKDERFEPVRGDRKEQLYYIAVCSNHAPASLDNSLLIDLDDVAIRGLPGDRGFHDAILYADTGDGFGDGAACSRRVPDRGEFVVSYSLRAFGPLKGVRWDPVERRFCRLRIDRIGWRDEWGGDHDIDPATVVTNGTREGDTFRFETTDPVVLLPVNRTATSLTIRGWLEVEEPEATLSRLEAACAAMRGELDRRQDEVNRHAAVIPRQTDALAHKDAVIAHQLGTLAHQDRVIALQTDALARQNDDITRLQGLVTTLYGDDGSGFRANLSRVVLLPGGGSGAFDLTFAVADFPAVKAFRWDPAECRLARVQLDEVLWEDAAGRVHRLDLSSVACNGTSSVPGWYEFDTPDPALLLPISGRVRSVTVRGRLSSDAPAASLVKLHARLTESARRLAGRDEQLRDVSAGLRSLVAEHEARGRELDETRADLDTATRRADALEAELRAVFASRKWRFIWSATNAAYYLPRLFRSLRQKLRQRLRA